MWSLTVRSGLTGRDLKDLHVSIGISRINKRGYVLNCNDHHLGPEVLADYANPVDTYCLSLSFSLVRPVIMKSTFHLEK